MLVTKIELNKENQDQVVSNDSEIKLGQTLKKTCARALGTVDEVSRIIQVASKDIRLSLELVEIQLHIAKGSALIDGVSEFMAKGMSQEDANNLMNQLRAD